MGSLSDRMLASGCASHIEAIHGETVEVLDGPDAGKTFTGVLEIEGDQVLLTDLGEDPRAKIWLRFINGNAPDLTLTSKIKTADGRNWNAIRRQEANFLTQDFELTAISGKDT